MKSLFFIILFIPSLAFSQFKKDLPNYSSKDSITHLNIIENNQKIQNSFVSMLFVSVASCTIYSLSINANGNVPKEVFFIGNVALLSTIGSSMYFMLRDNNYKKYHFTRKK